MEELEKAIDIIFETLPKSKHKEFVKLVFNDDKARLSNGEIQEYVLKITDNNLFIEDGDDDIGVGYHEDYEKSLLATKLSIILSTESTKVTNLDKDLKDNFYPYVDGKGNWFVITEENISFLDDFVNCINYTIRNMDDKKREEHLINKFEKISNDKRRISKMESFAKHISDDKFVYKNIEHFMDESKSYNG